MALCVYLGGNNCSCLFQALAATVDPMTLLKSLTSVPGPGDLGGEVMSCLTTNNCSCLFQALAATVDPMTLLKSLTSVPGPGGECFPWYMLPWRSHNFMSVPDLGSEVMSQKTSKLFLGGRQPLSYLMSRKKKLFITHDNDHDFLGEYQRKPRNQLRYYFAEYTRLIVDIVVVNSDL
ncbi:unnamed protein product [Rhizophagus irregularis]|nr:unnamed protein product [Rhizophagus irregularis]